MGTQAETERKVYTVSAFNRRLAGYVGRVRDVWVEGEVAELRSNPAWATVFLTLKDGRTGACLSATMQRRRFELIEPAVAEGERVQANGALQLYEARGELSFRVTALERVGAGDHAARLIEAAGLKGFRIGGASVSTKHANFLLNEGEATARDLEQLMLHVQQTVARVHGVHLEPEVRVIGEPA